MILATIHEPESLHKRIQDASPNAGAGIVLTNDGNAILREIDVSHPAAKVSIRALLPLSPSATGPVAQDLPPQLPECNLNAA